MDISFNLWPKDSPLPVGVKVFAKEPEEVIVHNSALMPGRAKVHFAIVPLF